MGWTLLRVESRNPCEILLRVKSCKPMWNLASYCRVYAWTQWIPSSYGGGGGLHHRKTRHIDLDWILFRVKSQKPMWNKIITDFVLFCKQKGIWSRPWYISKTIQDRWLNYKKNLISILTSITYIKVKIIRAVFPNVKKYQKFLQNILK